MNERDSFDGWTPLHYAAKFGHISCLNYLIANGANVNATDNSGCTALHVAAYHGQLELLKKLIDAGGNPAISDSTGLTALKCAEMESHKDCISYLKNRK